jgi:hypothetical protein
MPHDENNQMSYQRYRDADLVPATQILSLEETYKVSNYGRWIWGTLGLLILVTTMIAIRRVLLRRRPTAVRGIPIPDPLTPFTLLGFLRRIDSSNGLSPDRRLSLAQTIEMVERYYFADSPGETPDLRAIAETWGRYFRQDISTT